MLSLCAPIRRPHSTDGATGASLGAGCHPGSGIDAPGQWWSTRDKPALTLTTGDQVPDARLAQALLAHVAGAIESGMHRQSWRNPGTGDARWLRFLASCG